jgi:hypothetical protein
MAINTTETNIRLEAVNAYFGKKECRILETVSDVADSLQDTYHDLNWIDGDFNEIEGYFYFDTDPVIVGKTAIGPVPRTTGDSATVIASAIKASIDASGALVNVVQDGNALTIENRAPFSITAETDSGSTGFSLATARAGSGAKLGKTAQGGASVSLEAQTFEVKSDQTGENLLDDISIGTSSTIEMGIIELSKEQFELLIGSATGNTVQGASSKVVGYGESRLYDSMKSLGGMLVLRPIRLEGDQDYNSDVVLHSCAPLPSDINYSGSDQQVLNVSFKPYLDGSVKKEVNLIAFGDWTQDEIYA